jgi:hypothetical protein
MQLARGGRVASQAADRKEPCVPIYSLAYRCLLNSVIALIFSISFGSAGFAAEAASSALPKWRRDYSLILADVSTPAADRNTRETIKRLGGRVAVTSPPDVVFGWIPESQHSALLRAGIRAVYKNAVVLDTIKGSSDMTLAAARFLNAVSSGEFFSRPSYPQDELKMPDAFQSPSLRLDGYLNEDMSGYVNVACLFIESVYAPNVPDSDPDTYTWSESEFWDVYYATWAGLSRWVDMAADRSVELTFSLGAGYPWGNSVLQQPYEPILHSWWNYDMWLEPVMAGFGWTVGTGKARVEAWNEWRKGASGADHATTFVFVKNGPSHPHFTNGSTSAAFLGGPFVQMPYIYSVGVEAEQAHELAHIFWACDEYSGSCNCEGSCSRGPRSQVPNCNCAACAGSVPCILKTASSTAVCDSTAQKIGWIEPSSTCE